MVLYQTQFIIKILEQFVWVEKTLQNRALKITERSITAKYFTYLKSPFLGHDSKTVIPAKKVKKGYQPSNVYLFLKQGCNYKNV